MTLYKSANAGTFPADEAAGRARVELGELGRRCADPTCGKPLARMNRETLCFACLGKWNAANVRVQKLHPSQAEVRGGDPLRFAGKRGVR